MGLLGRRSLDLEHTYERKRLLALVETDGCAADGIAVATDCWVGRRTLRVIDYGKVAATFIDTYTERAVRIAPQAGVRERAAAYAPESATHWEAQLLGYQHMPDHELLVVRAVALTFSLEQLLSKEGRRVTCEKCGEEIINEREVYRNGTVLCRACAGNCYYWVLALQSPLLEENSSGGNHGPP